MLILSRKPGERILIGDNIAVTFIRYSGAAGIRLGIEAPEGTLILREELTERPQNDSGTEDTQHDAA